MASGKAPLQRRRRAVVGNATVEDFIKRDLEDAKRCDLMVVYMPRLSAGACMELFYAKRKGKKVIVVSALDCLSP